MSMDRIYFIPHSIGFRTVESDEERSGTVANVALFAEAINPSPFGSPITSPVLYIYDPKMEITAHSGGKITLDDSFEFEGCSKRSMDSAKAVIASAADDKHPLAFDLLPPFHIETPEIMSDIDAFIIASRCNCDEFWREEQCVHVASLFNLWNEPRKSVAFRNFGVTTPKYAKYTPISSKLDVKHTKSSDLLECGGASGSSRIRTAASTEGVEGAGIIHRTKSSDRKIREHETHITADKYENEEIGTPTVVNIGMGAGITSPPPMSTLEAMGWKRGNAKTRGKNKR